MIQDNTAKVIYLLIQKLNIPVTDKSINDELLIHPAPNSLLAISDVLDQWNIPNGAYAISFDKLAGLPLPYIAYFNRKEFLLVTGQNEKQIVVSNERWINHSIDIEDFRASYAGSVLIAEKDEISGEPGYKEKKLAEQLEKIRLPLTAMLSALLFIAFVTLHSGYLVSVNLPIALLTLFKTAGVCTSILLLLQSINANNAWIQKLCNKDGNDSCNTILSSNAARPVSWLTWSEVGFFYFAGSWLTLVFNSSNNHVLQIFALLNLTCLPYTVYSIRYQWFVAKQWCKLCCTVQILLWLEFFPFLSYLKAGIPQLDVKEIINIGIAFSLPVIAWVILKPYLIQQKEIQPLREQLQRFKYNADMFNKLLVEETYYPLLDDEYSIVVGNREADHVITMVINPYCQPCAKAHKKVDEWLNGRPDIKLQMLFTTYDNEKDRRAKVASHFYSLVNTSDDKFIKSAVNDWYGQKQKDYETWAKMHPTEINANGINAIEKQREWCQTAVITSTPTIFINGRRLPRSYQVEDIKYFL